MTLKKLREIIYDLEWQKVENKIDLAEFERLKSFAYDEYRRSRNKEQ